MRWIARLLALLCVLVALGQALALRHATKGQLFTQLPSETLAKMEAAKPADDAFAGLGINDLAGEPAKVDNTFRFGLLPAGPGNGFADSASVLTAAGPACLLAIFTFWYTRRPRKA